MYCSIEDITLPEYQSTVPGIVRDFLKSQTLSDYSHLVDMIAEAIAECSFVEIDNNSGILLQKAAVDLEKEVFHVFLKRVQDDEVFHVTMNCNLATQWTLEATL